MTEKLIERPKIRILGRSADKIYVGVSAPSDAEKGVDGVNIIDNELYYASSGPDVLSSRRLQLFWDLMDVLRLQGYMRASISVIGRSAIGPGWELVKDTYFGDEATDMQAKRLRKFYANSAKKWDNIKDWYTLVQKILISSQYLKYFGQAAFHILRNERGTPLGIDFLYGLVVPNVNENGEFESDGAYHYYPSRDISKKVVFNNPRDVLYIVNPAFDGSHIGASDVESLTEFNLPLSIYLSLAARRYMENRDTPELVYELPADISDDAFDEFVEVLQSKYAGPQNIGRNPVVVAGELNIKEISNELPTDLPYGEARLDTLNETLAVTGTNVDKLGIPSNVDTAAFKERRREFHETTMIPLFRIIEESLYEQVHIREFNAPGWRFNFKQPDFLTAVERATVHMRYSQQGVLNPNEIRAELGKPERTDEFGDKYIIPSGTQDEPQGSPPEGREDRPDAPGEVGEPTIDDQDPPRGDGHDDVSSEERFVSPAQELEAITKELEAYKSFYRNRKGSPSRDFVFLYVPDTVGHLITSSLEECSSIEEENQVFSDALEEITTWYTEKRAW